MILTGIPMREKLKAELQKELGQATGKVLLLECQLAVANRLLAIAKANYDYNDLCLRMMLDAEDE